MCTLVGSCIRAVIRIDFTHHAFFTFEGVVITLAATIDITADSDMLISIRESLIILDTDVHIGIALYISQVTAAIDISANFGTEDGFWSIAKANHIHRLFCYDVDSGIARYITLVTTAKDFADGSDSGCNIAFYRLLVIGDTT